MGTSHNLHILLRTYGDSLAKYLVQGNIQTETKHVCHNQERNNNSSHSYILLTEKVRTEL